METLITLVPERRQTRLVARRGNRTLLRGTLPPLSAIRHENALLRLLEGVALVADTRVSVALLAGDSEHSLRLGLTDELGFGAGSVFFNVLVPGPTGQGDLWSGWSRKCR